jgi:hypothetical protein
LIKVIRSAIAVGRKQAKVGAGDGGDEQPLNISRMQGGVFNANGERADGFGRGRRNPGGGIRPGRGLQERCAGCAESDDEHQDDSSWRTDGCAAFCHGYIHGYGGLYVALRIAGSLYRDDDRAR